MELHNLLRSCFNEDLLRMFLDQSFDQAGRDVWDSTDGPWLSRSFDIAKALEREGLAGRRLFELLVKEVPNRADDIAAACRTTTGQPFNYTTEEAPPAEAFPWADYQDGMSPGLVAMLRYAAYDARSRGFPTISTSEIVRVYLVLQPWVAATLVADKSKRADLDGTEDPFDGSFGASYCVSKTFHGLAENTPRPTRYDEHDVFLDLVRFGNGKSVRKLAPSGEKLDEVNALSRELEIGRITRHAVLDHSI